MYSEREQMAVSFYTEKVLSLVVVGFVRQGNWKIKKTSRSFFTIKDSI